MNTQYSHRNPRREKISKVVLDYIKNNPQEYSQFKKQMLARKINMADERLGIVGEDKKADKASAMRVTFSFPEKLWDALKNLDLEPPFIHQENSKWSRKEEKWFSKEFPEFLLPNKY